MSGALADRCATFLDRVGMERVGPMAIGRLRAFDGLMIEASGLDLPVGATARVEAGGRSIIAEVVGFRGRSTMMMPLEEGVSLTTGGRVTGDGAPRGVAVGAGLLGRVVDSLGRPIDGGGPIFADALVPITGAPGNVLNRASVCEPLSLGVRAIDAMLTAGVGQRIAIIAGSGVGKSVLMGQILAGVDAEVIVVGLVGERGREVSDFLNHRLPPHVRAKSVVVAVPADHAPMLRLRAAMRATAIAEHFRGEGRRVLLLIDSLTRVAHAQREIGLSLGEPPTVKGYPPSALGLIPRLVERAGNDGASGGSITAIYTVLADGDDHDDPIVDAARAIVDGHIILSRPMAEQSIFPAIDLGRSLSRVMNDVVSADHAAAAQRIRRLWSDYEGSRDLILMGAYAAGSDPAIDAAIERRGAILDFIRQPAGECCKMDAALAALQALADQ